MSGAEAGLVVAERFFRSFESGDFQTLERILAVDAKIWHNDGNGEQSRADNLETLKLIHANIESYAGRFPTAMSAAWR
ncbi:hypothetical protein [Amycolatopsis pithecellobii]|uniref:SnoaL-like domain-containing protein n=1 Tax=Amycolatopsis pithecellobii TaxID=664692 RepID=A0A6N7Z887_9PSEU|nr:hypothetical protein [Amycolatopsis pithecellobii]MTD56556.1 hypothetical protein [Amycolatopsis pithecellobii]